MLRRKSSGDGVTLSAVYAPVRPRRKRQEPPTATGNGSLPQASAMFLATVAALAPPPQQRSSAAPSRSILQKNRAVKPMANQSTRLKLDRDQYDGGGEVSEREETPRRIPNALTPPHDLPLKAKLLLQESGACTQEKLAYDELMRYQRSRVEDMAKFYGLADERQEESQATRKEREAFRKAAGFREEWRIGAFCLPLLLIDFVSDWILFELICKQTDKLCELGLLDRSRRRDPG